MRAGDAAAPSLDPTTIAANNTEFEPEPAPVAPPKPKPVEPPKPKVEAPPAPKPEPKPVVEEKAAPTGKAYVVQLGALKNADKVNEIVGKLRGAGYRVYTSPSTPVQGKITRILVGPDASKDKLKGSLGELKQLSGLSGVVMAIRRINTVLPDATLARLISLGSVRTVGRIRRFTPHPTRIARCRKGIKSRWR
ncbi:DedD protein [Escherichia coli ISC7]|uniref:DedD protein n=1 Tax=Escherichia coli ISC7 TaxID=1432555 RepID=W1FB27_ECOLX|nr:DedD protein [Escherichia coli ISC7]